MRKGSIDPLGFAFTTTSLKVAKAFGKRHDNVVRDIEVIINTLKSNGIDVLNFEEISIPDAYDRPRKAYQMDRNAYTQLVSSFTGEKATVFRKKYADAFDKMESVIRDKQFGGFAIPRTLSEALKLAATQADSQMPFLGKNQRLTETTPWNCMRNINLFLLFFEQSG